jgi:phospholipase/lecithinase/hemolysin
MKHMSSTFLKKKDPSARFFWDGSGHLTEAANRYIADEWLSSIISPPPVLLAYYY